jgi:hypothetical protein
VLRFRGKHKSAENRELDQLRGGPRWRGSARLLMGDRSSARFGGRCRSSPTSGRHRRPALATASIRALAGSLQAPDARLWRGPGTRPNFSRRTCFPHRVVLPLRPGGAVRRPAERGAATRPEQSRLYRHRGRLETGLAVFARPVQELETDAALAIYSRHLGDRDSAVAVIALPLLGAALVGRADETKRLRDLDGPVNTSVEPGAADDRRCSCLSEKARARCGVDGRVGFVDLRRDGREIDPFLRVAVPNFLPPLLVVRELDP